jgi:hypothetical protein
MHVRLLGTVAADASHWFRPPGAQLRTRLADADERATRLELMLPNDRGEFRALRAEMEELEKVGPDDGLMTA